MKRMTASPIDLIHHVAGKQLARRRRALGVTQAEFARLMGYGGQSVVARKERGLRIVTKRDLLGITALELQAAAEKVVHAHPDDLDVHVRALQELLERER